MIVMNYEDICFDYDGWDTAYYPENTLFTGRVVEFYEKTQSNIFAIREWKDGLEDGVARQWDHQGRLENEAQKAFNFTHGESRSWYPNGQLKSWCVCEYDYVVESIRWDEDGNIVAYETLDEHHPKGIYEKMAVTIIPARRQEYQRPLPPPLRDAPDGELLEPLDYSELLEKYRYLQKDPE